MSPWDTMLWIRIFTYFNNLFLNVIFVFNGLSAFSHFLLPFLFISFCAVSLLLLLHCNTYPYSFWLYFSSSCVKGCIWTYRLFAIKLFFPTNSVYMMSVCSKLFINRGTVGDIYFVSMEKLRKNIKRQKRRKRRV